MSLIDPSGSATLDLPGSEQSEKSEPATPTPEATAEKIRATRAASSTERVRKYRQRKKAEGEPQEQAQAVPITITDAEVAEAANVSEIVWGLAVVPFSGGRILPLNTDQAHRLGKAVAPLIKKYVPILGQWQYEVGALLVVASLVKECWNPNPPTADDQEKTPTPTHKS